MGSKGKTTSTLGRDKQIRLNKYIADSGLVSRRKADVLIADGKVQVNGKTVFELGVRVDPQMDRVTVEGHPIRLETRKIYVAFYKPENVLTSMEDPLGRPTVADYIERLPVRVFPVGRLDWDTEGLLLLTNDGDFAQRVMHPKHEIPKTYMVKINGRIKDEQLEKLRRGVRVMGSEVQALSAERISGGKSEQYDWVKLVIGEGKNRQVRRMFEKIGFDVKKLKRVAIGQLSIGPLRKGDFAFLDQGSLDRIFAQRREPLARRRPRPRSQKRKTPI